MRSEDQPCAYEGCKVPTTEKEDQYCQFHRRENPLPADQYLSVFTHYVNSGANDFRGFVFPEDITIKNLSFPKGAYFRDAVFTGNFTMHDCSISGDADFQRAKFEGVSKFVRLNLVDNKTKGDASTYLPLHLKFLAATFHKGAMFSGMKQVHSLQLDHSNLNGHVSFHDIEALGGVFLNNMRSEEGISFGNCICCKEFHCSEVHLKKDLKLINCKINAAFFFRDTTCEGALILDKTELPNNVGFEVINSSLGDGIEVSNCTINRRLHFENLKFGDHASVRIIEPTLEAVNATSKTGSFIFSGMTLPEYRTTFKGFKSCDSMTLPLLRIDHCNLNKGYFEECDFSSISLYTSDYDNAVFLNCDWPSLKSPKRDNAIYEDRYIHSSEIREAHGPAQRNDSLKGLSLIEVSSMYNRFKNAFDGLKRYETSGDFYYNEIELKREHYWQTNKTNWLLYTQGHFI